MISQIAFDNIAFDNFVRLRRSCPPRRGGEVQDEPPQGEQGELQELKVEVLKFVVTEVRELQELKVEVLKFVVTEVRS